MAALGGLQGTSLKGLLALLSLHGAAWTGSEQPPELQEVYCDDGGVGPGCLG